MVRRLIALSVLLLVGCGEQSKPRPAKATAKVQGQSAYTLPEGTQPKWLALASDGSIWVTQEWSGTLRLDPSGKTREFLAEEGNYFTDITPGPDGAVRLVAERAIQLNGIGHGSWWPGSDEAEAQAITSRGDVTWVAHGDDAEGLRIIVRYAAGARREFRDRRPRRVWGVKGMAAAPDGSVWFTEDGYRRGSIGRLSADGVFTYRALPKGFGFPGRMAAGADGAIWFTGKHVLGRIAPDGQMASFRVPGYAAPHDIVAGANGEMWFTSDLCLARVNGTGAITTWPVPGAEQLEGLAVAADGSVWLADRTGDAIRHFDPAGAAPAPCGADALEQTVGPTTATLAFERIEDDFFWDFHMRIVRDGRELLSEGVPGIDEAVPRGTGKSLTVRDLDGDGEPEVLATFSSQGMTCCAWSRIYRYEHGAYAVQRRFWGPYGAEPRLRDLDGDGRTEILSLDDRFSGRFARASIRPLRIWSYRAGKLHDVTRRHPEQVRKDAAKLWKTYKDSPGQARTILPAWMADQYLLGRQAHADRVLAQAAARGELKKHYGYKPYSVEAWLAAVNSFLQRFRPRS